MKNKMSHKETIALTVAVASRLILVGMLLGTEVLQKVWQGDLSWPILGTICMPLTTLCYIGMSYAPQTGSDGWHLLMTIIVIFELSWHYGTLSIFERWGNNDAS